MRKITRVFAAFATAGILGSAGAAGAATIGFEGIVAPGSAGIPSTPYSEGGYSLTNSLGSPPPGIEGIFDSGFGGINSNGSAVFGWCGSCLPGIKLTLTDDAAELFSLTSFEASNLFTGFFDPNMTIQVTGHLGAGGTVMQRFALAQDIYPTFLLNAGFTGLASVDFEGTPYPTSNLGDFAIDNLIVGSSTTSVAEPGTLAILGIGLLGIGYLRRRRAA